MIYMYFYILFMYYINHFSFLEGFRIVLHLLNIWWFPEPVWYAGVCRLQSAGEAQTGPVGYQTDTSHIRASLWGRAWQNSGLRSHLGGTVPSHAEAIEWLYTSPPRSTTVRYHNKLLMNITFRFYKSSQGWCWRLKSSGCIKPLVNVYWRFES